MYGLGVSDTPHADASDVSRQIHGDFQSSTSKSWTSYNEHSHVPPNHIDTTTHRLSTHALYLPPLPQHPHNPHTTAKMVKLEEVPDEDFIAQQQGPKVEEEDDWDTDSGTHTTIIHNVSSTAQTY